MSGAKVPADLEPLSKCTASNLEAPPSRFNKLNLGGYIFNNMLVISSKWAHLVAAISYSFYNQINQKYLQICFDRNAIVCVQEKS